MTLKEVLHKDLKTRYSFYISFLFGIIFFGGFLIYRYVGLLCIACAYMGSVWTIVIMRKDFKNW